MQANTTREARNWGLAAHLAGALAGFVVPFGGLLSSLVIWLVRKETDPFSAGHALEVLNFRLTVVIGGVVAGALVLTVVLIPVGLILALLILVSSLVYGVPGAVAASKGNEFTYPAWIPRLVKGA